MIELTTSAENYFEKNIEKKSKVIIRSKSTL